MTLRGAWDIEMTDRGLAYGVPGEEDARALYYTGAAAMMAMTVASLAADHRPPFVALDAFFTRMKMEISEYLEQESWPDAD